VKVGDQRVNLLHTIIGDCGITGAHKRFVDTESPFGLVDNGLQIHMCLIRHSVYPS
jgi:hypothetical protein